MSSRRHAQRSGGGQLDRGMGPLNSIVGKALVGYWPETTVRMKDRLFDRDPSEAETVTM